MAQQFDYNNVHPNTLETSISISEILAIAKIYGFEVLKYSWLMILVGILLGNYMRNRKLESPTTYTAYCSFKINEQSSATQQGISQLFGSVGGNESPKVTLKDLKEMIKTRYIIHKALFSKVTLKHTENGQKDFLINHFLRQFSYQGVPSENQFYFSSENINPYNRKENSLIKSIHSNIANNFIEIDVTPTGTANLKAISQNEDFSYELANTLFSELDSFYIKNRLEKKENFYKMAVERTNELKSRLHLAESNYITHMNGNSSEAGGRHETLIKTQFLSSTLKSFTEAYFTSLKSQEAAWITYERQKQSPVFQMIDQPLYPLQKEIPNPFLHMIFGFIGGFGLIFLLVIGRKFMQDFLAKQKENTIETVSPKEEMTP